MKERIRRIYSIERDKEKNENDHLVLYYGDIEMHAASVGLEWHASNQLYVNLGLQAH